MSIIFLGFFTLGALLSGCKQPEILTDASTADNNPATPSQNESQFVVHAIVSDVAEQVYFAKFHHVPKNLSVNVTEVGGSAEQPVYNLQVRLDSKLSTQKIELTVDRPIWSPDLYRPIVQELARVVKLRVHALSRPEVTSVLSKLLDSTPETIEQQNEEISRALEQDFADPQLHEQAALLLGAFTMREHSGALFEARSPLSRLTAHLVMAQLLRGSNGFGINGQVAEAMMLTMVNNQVAAIDQLNRMNTNDPAVAAVVRGLLARNTGDYRPLNMVTNRSPFESIEWFYAMADRIDTGLAWPKLTEEQRQRIDFVRVAGDVPHSVEVGNELLEKSIPLELQEIKSIYKLAHPGQAVPDEIATALNVFPASCFDVDVQNKTHVRVIDWGQWAMFFQRQLCHAVEVGFNSINTMLGDHDGAKVFADNCERSFGKLTLYPFVRRADATEMEGYHKAVDDSAKVVAAVPQFVPAACWNSLYTPVTFGPTYQPKIPADMNQWYDRNLLPGVAYDLDARLGQSSLTNRPNAMTRLETLHELAPYHRQLSRFIVHVKYNGNPTYDQALALYGKMLPYSPVVMRAVANNSLTGDVDRYEQLMAQAAELDPSYYYDLGQYEFDMNNFTREDKAAEYFQKGFDMDPDRVAASYHAEWLVKHWLKRQRTAKAREIAEEAGGVYSEPGLSALAYFQEATSNYDGAFQTFANMEERYGNSTALLNFCSRYKAQTGDERFEPEVQKRVGKLFPQGMERVSLEDFQGPPTDGVAFGGDSYAMYQSGLSFSNVIVAVYGVRVHNTAQYTFGRTLKDTPELDLIVWQGNAYRELKPNLPGHLFGVPIHDYSPYAQ